MSGFSTDWLAAREPVDLRARNTTVRDAFLAFLTENSRASPLRLLDLGAGTGATARALAPHCPQDTIWRFAEHDPALIAEAERRATADGLVIETVSADLSAGLPASLLEGVDGVTTSAFLDLVSGGWTAALAATLRASRLPFLAMLTFDGRQSLSPTDPLDGRIEAAMRTHQGRDKGFGPALGPDAHTHAVETFAQAGFLVTQGPSDWEALPGEAAFQKMLVDGWAGAARETGAPDADISRWQALRHDQIAAGRLVTRVGHRDLAALPRV
jgi:hypothetical protein